ncbi:hypothetical protein C8F01DRAFT_1175984 [Mycena amicta]|nr:hypothetical protein C8F01DRAFT_1175984 [Mycena amicta]
MGAGATYSSGSISLALSLTSANHYGAPTPPWQPNHKPGWYCGQGSPPTGVVGILEGLFCDLLDLFPFVFHCPKPPPPPPPHQPPPPPAYQQKFYGLTCASQDDSYLTYGLVDTVEDCQYMCNGVQGCVFVNSAANKFPQDFSPLLTCSLFSKCLTNSTADNCGGQPQPNDGGVNYITDSAGYCKNGY